jgi:CheY-like chemotaxis protein
MSDSEPCGSSRLRLKNALLPLRRAEAIPSIWSPIRGLDPTLLPSVQPFGADPNLRGMLAPIVGKCVLIADDHDGVRKALRALFLSNGFEVCAEAINGLDAIEKAQEVRPDLIVLDLSMPVMNGLAAARELTKIMPKVPVLMFTNHAGPMIEYEAQRAGIRSVMSKDGSYERLLNRARELLN